MFWLRLDSIICMEHPPVCLAAQAPWAEFETSFGGIVHPRTGPSGSANPFAGGLALSEAPKRSFEQGTGETRGRGPVLTVLFWVRVFPVRGSARLVLDDSQATPDRRGAACGDCRIARLGWRVLSGGGEAIEPEGGDGGHNLARKGDYFCERDSRLILHAFLHLVSTEAGGIRPPPESNASSTSRGTADQWHSDTGRKFL